LTATGRRIRSSRPLKLARRRCKNFRPWAPDRSGVQREEAKPAATAQHYLFEATGMRRFLAWLATPPGPDAGAVRQRLHALYRSVGDFLTAAVQVTRSSRSALPYSPSPPRSSSSSPWSPWTGPPGSPPLGRWTRELLRLPLRQAVGAAPGGARLGHLPVAALQRAPELRGAPVCGALRAERLDHGGDVQEVPVAEAGVRRWGRGRAVRGASDPPRWRDTAIRGGPKTGVWSNIPSHPSGPRGGLGWGARGLAIAFLIGRHYRRLAGTA